MSVEKMSSSTYFRVEVKGTEYSVTELYDATSQHTEFEVYDEEGNAVYDDETVGKIIKEVENYQSR